MPVALILDVLNHKEEEDAEMMMAGPPNSMLPHEDLSPRLMKCGTDNGKNHTEITSSVMVYDATTDDDSEFDDDWSYSDNEDNNDDDMTMNEAVDDKAVPVKHHYYEQQPPAEETLVATAFSILTSPSVEIDDILAVMRALPMNPHVQCLSCEKLWVASWEDDAAEGLVDQGGIQLVLEAMSRFSQYERLQQCACETLQNVAALEDDACQNLQWLPQQEICQRGGVGLIVNAMQTHAHNHSLQLSGCTTLTSLAVDLPENHAIIREEGAIDALVQALQRHGRSQKSLEWGARQALEALGYQATPSS